MKLEIRRVGEKEFGWQKFFDFKPCLTRNFGTSVNDLNKFSTKMGGIKTSLRSNGIAIVLVNAQLKEDSAMSRGNTAKLSNWTNTVKTDSIISISCMETSQGGTFQRRGSRF
ncbi:hypothetical protein AVEN_91501-1 [Araneus ventricosus]|uniref:Uncharacterized protein n=1 Tax=Araneus ventricosus TaxID=182803 RepID=A0A4Y2BJM1_ARAVE|nr:hypothetical protein AVEN_91501-1 [Araneus ventricosus]